MVFSSTIFLFLFLPVVLALYFALRPGLRNGWLLLASLTYYAWGESTFLGLVLLSIFGNYLFGLALQRLQAALPRKLMLAFAVSANIGLLVWYKYANFLAGSLNDLLLLAHSQHAPIILAPIALPLGISFFTFHALSYVVDIYRRQAVAQRSLPLLCLYILFFPQLIAGPIVRYHEISDQLSQRKVDVTDLAAGIERFVVGLTKKMLIANTAAQTADGIFAVLPADLTAPLAWLGVGAYAIQVYFDFSGYSDMAIGLARLFGFRFPENFDYPYIARSMTEFWQRWHLSLSRFFRDYLYIPLGGNRRGRARTYVNLATVFLLCGLWHGASWNFVCWGALHGAFLIVERLGLLRILERTWSPVRHVYCLTVVLITWVFFRSPNLLVTSQFLHAMVGLGQGAGTAVRAVNYLDDECLLALGAGVVFSTPIAAWLKRQLRLPSAAHVALFDLSKLVTLVVMAVASAMRLSSGTYNPFIYFRF
ncbi:MAG: MBOAT family O-acyltransferase [Pseudomonadota bacterium]